MTTVPGVSRGPAVRVERAGALLVAEHLLRAMRASWFPVLITGIASPVLYLSAMGLGFAALMGSRAPGGGDYVAFLAPALVVGAAVTVAASEFGHAALGGFTWRRVFWAMNVTPLSPPQVADGVAIAVACRVTATAGVYALIAVGFGAVTSPQAVLGTTAVALVTALAFGLPVLAHLVSARQPTGRLGSIQRFVVTPMYLFSGTFFPVDTYPTPVRWLAWLSPLWHGNELSRAAAGESSVTPLLLAAHGGALLVVLTVGWVWSRRAFTRRMRR